MTPMVRRKTRPTGPGVNYLIYFRTYANAISEESVRFEFCKQNREKLGSRGTGTSANRCLLRCQPVQEFEVLIQTALALSPSISELIRHSQTKNLSVVKLSATRPGGRFYTKSQRGVFALPCFLPFIVFASKTPE